MDIRNIDLGKLCIVHYPDPVLRKVAEPIEEIGPEVADLAERMIELKIASDGIGLAAPQVGLPLRLVVACLNGDRDDVLVLINPELGDFQGSTDMEEGCLSLPGIRANVRRPTACSMAALDLSGNRIFIDAVDLPARVLQHETDHLDGKLFIDRLNTVSRFACRRGLKQLERDYSGE